MTRELEERNTVMGAARLTARSEMLEGVRTFTESVVEDAALAWLEGLGYAVLYGPAIAAGEPGAERRDPRYRDVVLDHRLRQALVRLNTELPPEAVEDAVRKLTRGDAPTLIARNRMVHRMLLQGVDVEYREADGSLGAGREWFKPWRTIGGREDAPLTLAELQVVLEGVFDKRRFLDLVRYFI